MTVLCTYTNLKDHRTGCETSNVDKVMDGEIKMFTDAYLIWMNAGSPSVK